MKCLTDRANRRSL